MVCAMTVTASSDYIAQFMPDRTNAVQLHAICTEVALVHLGGVVTVKNQLRWCATVRPLRDTGLHSVCLTFSTSRTIECCMVSTSSTSDPSPISVRRFGSRASCPRPLQIGCDRVISRGEATRSVGVVHGARNDSTPFVHQIECVGVRG